MNEKKEKLIKTAIKLFAEKGFHTTSIQEIAEKSEVSKGAFYLHFHSKDELLLEIFKYYYEIMNEKIYNAFSPERSTKENFFRQIEVQLSEILEHSSFIITQLREQAITLNKDLIDFMHYKEVKLQKWYEGVLIDIYGEEIKPYVMDLIFMFEGIKNNFLQMLIKDIIEVDTRRLATYLIERLDDLVKQLLSRQESPLITKEQIKSSYADLASPQEYIKKEVTKELIEMQNLIHDLNLSEDRVCELQGVADFLLSEMQKAEPKKIVIQGMLANFKGISEFDKYRKWISQKLNVRLL
ncbi:TetR/AcrR family transcriptional regulator [Aquibacillus sp. 3ASR75-11]|uniref:TetR/AcrR family transcriptional regulator n=1 Tax=Terrihalobacillus insolitus TaxID=2950438 RepID=A0A9X3WV93_9BACI|nr:TetR/AcrR family transcriptional regulator [Terrihalobacillus insolitus]MDC3415179.1 TetR/AcrR family transcriptional regulator [Terrihalobacillus insolitus]MDC3424049.1 TetR/AcrR family transcriptional regulator [Terrihalobacillus insolitus]